jgi:hypothetical protein
MSAKAFEKLYDEFTAEERFRLVIAAMARADKADVERLGRTCPKKTYTMSDAAYSDRLEVCETLTLVILLELMPKLAKLRMVDVFRYIGEYLGGLIDDATCIVYMAGYKAGAGEAWKRAGRKGDAPEMAPDDTELDDLRSGTEELRARIEGLLNGLRDELARDARTARDAHVRFCSEHLNLSSADVMNAFAPNARQQLEEFSTTLDGVEGKLNEIDALLDVMRCAWRRRALGDMSAEVSLQTRALLEADGMQVP